MESLWHPGGWRVREAEAVWGPAQARPASLVTETQSPCSGPVGGTVCTVVGGGVSLVPSS